MAKGAGTTRKSTSNAPKGIAPLIGGGSVAAYMKYGELSQQIAGKEVKSEYNSYSGDRVFTIEENGFIDQIRVHSTPNSDGYYKIEMPDRYGNISVAQGIMESLSKIGVKKFEVQIVHSTNMHNALVDRLGFTRTKLERDGAFYFGTYRKK